MVCKGQTGEGLQPPLPGTSLPDPGADMQSILQAIHEDRVFGLTQVDIHTPEDLKDKFCDLPSIFKGALLSKEDAGSHMARYCETTGLISQPWMSLISSYFARWVLIPTPLLRWYLWSRSCTSSCSMIGASVFRPWLTMHPEATGRLTGPIAGPSRGISEAADDQCVRKCCKNKARFMQTYFVKGPVASKAVCSNRFRDMKPLLAAPLSEAAHSVRARPEMDLEDMS